VKDFKPVHLFDEYAFAVELLSTHGHVDGRLRTNCIFADSCQKMSCQKLVYAPLRVTQLVPLCVFHRVDGWMCLVIVLTLLWWSPQLTRTYAFCECTEALTRDKRVADLLQVDRRIVLSRLSTRVAQETFVVQLLHMLHRLLRRNTQFLRNQLLCLDSIERVRLELCDPLFHHVCYFCHLCCFDLKEQYSSALLVEEPVSLPLETCCLVLVGGTGILQVDKPKLFRLKLLDLLVSFDDEPERWELAGSVADDAFLVWHQVPKGECLEPCKRSAYT